MKKVLLILIFVLAATSFAAKAPTHRSIRAEAMGNAHVALVDDKEAIYFNYAGLTQINRLGNYNLRPEQGYYPRNRGDMRLNFGGAGPFQTYFSTYNVAKDLQKIYNDARNVAKNNGLSSSNVLMDSLAAHPELVHTINSYDHKNLSMKIKMDAELAFHNFGGAFWVDGTIAPYLDAGIFLPQVVIDTFYVDAVAQAGGAYEFIDGLSVGGGLKIAKRHKVDIITVSMSGYKSLQDSLEDRYHDVSDELFDMDAISLGMDLGVLYQLTREVRLGTSLRDIYFKSLAGDKFTPNWTLGVNYSPRFFNKNTAFSRKFNLAFDYADALNAGITRHSLTSTSVWKSNRRYLPGPVTATFSELWPYAFLEVSRAATLPQDLPSKHYNSLQLNSPPGPKNWVTTPARTKNVSTWVS